MSDNFDLMITAFSWKIHEIVLYLFTIYVYNFFMLILKLSEISEQETHQ